MRAGARLLCQRRSVTDRASEANLDALTRSLAAASWRRRLTSAAAGALGGLVAAARRGGCGGRAHADRLVHRRERLHCATATIATPRASRPPSVAS
jgi:hypothetical protein